MQEDQSKNIRELFPLMCCPGGFVVNRMLCGGWAKAQIPKPIEHGVDAPSAMPSVSLSTRKIRFSVTQHRGSSRIGVSAFSTDGSLLSGVQEGSPLHTWFRGTFGGSGSIPPWCTTTRHTEHPFGRMPRTNILDQDVSCREAIRMLVVGTVPSLKSGSIDLWYTLTRFSARSLLEMLHALCQ
jgi:hypothetical protein